MAELLMIADDMTGTLDSGVMLSARNIDTLVQIDCFAEMDAVLTGCDAAVINTETRHLPQEEAFERIRRIVERAEALGVPYIYRSGTRISCVTGGAETVVNFLSLYYFAEACRI